MRVKGLLAILGIATCVEASTRGNNNIVKLKDVKFNYKGLSLEGTILLQGSDMILLDRNLYLSNKGHTVSLVRGTLNRLKKTVLLISQTNGEVIELPDLGEIDEELGKLVTLNIPNCFLVQSRINFINNPVIKLPEIVEDKNLEKEDDEEQAINFASQSTIETSKAVSNLEKQDTGILSNEPTTTDPKESLGVNDKIATKEGHELFSSITMGENSKSDKSGITSDQESTNQMPTASSNSTPLPSSNPVERQIHKLKNINYNVSDGPENPPLPTSHEKFLGFRENLRNTLKSMQLHGKADIEDNRVPSSVHNKANNENISGGSVQLGSLNEEFALIIDDMDSTNQNNEKSPLTINLLADNEIQETITSWYREPFLSLTGITVYRTRENLLKQVLNSQKKSRTPLDLTIKVGISSEDLLVQFLESDAVSNVMIQFRAANYERLFTQLNSQGVPALALLRDKMLKNNLPLHNLESINERGDALLVQAIQENIKEIVQQLESQSRVLVFADTAICDMKNEFGKFVLPDTNNSKKACFCITQGLDLLHTTCSSFQENRDMLAKLIILYYEAAYLAAIQQKSKILILQPVFVNKIKTEKLAFDAWVLTMESLIRVHKRLSPYLSARKVILATELAIPTPWSKWQSELKQQLNVLARTSTQIWIESPIDNSGAIPLIDNQLDDHYPLNIGPINPEKRTNANSTIMMELHQEEDRIIIEGWLHNGLGLSEYFNEELTGTKHSMMPTKLIVDGHQFGNTEIELVRLNLPNLMKKLSPGDYRAHFLEIKSNKSLQVNDLDKTDVLPIELPNKTAGVSIEEANHIDQARNKLEIFDINDFQNFEEDDENHGGDDENRGGDDENRGGDDENHDGGDENHGDDDENHDGDDENHGGDDENHGDDDENHGGDDENHGDDDENHDGEDENHDGGDDENHNGDENHDGGDEENYDGDGENHDNGKENHDGGDENHDGDNEDGDNSCDNDINSDSFSNGDS